MFTLNTIERHGVAMKMFYDGTQTASTLTVNGANGAQRMPDKKNFNGVIETMDEPKVHYAVRRLIPEECELLQGFPVGWTDLGDWTDSKGKKHKAADSPRYKALGNSIALPFWDYLAENITEYEGRKLTVGSLFDGIGGFPRVFEKYNGKGTARWASEVEEFCIAVTKKWFPEPKEKEK